jgi:aspartyl-tRNA(Asn)/glutamyl-tRNA(Gln) amidotransferase subunit B
MRGVLFFAIIANMSNGYTTTIGLEVHAELHTNSKMWCGCKNDPHEKRPNVNICEVCMAHPGTLPVANKEAIKKVITVGLAVDGEIADFTEFDRKNYFYPDIPKGYQLSQYKLPIVVGGEINGIKLTRIHLEEDTAKSSHENGETLVDYNRAGVPLMELVTEPVIHDADTAVLFARELQRILRYVGASEANMELGQMRIEANISVSKDKTFGTKVEVKNINSFASVYGAIKYEVDRHIELLEKGELVVQETRGWDENKQITFSQRKKENAHDYRYFPDPDLPKLYLHKLFNIDEIKSSLPELPKDRRIRYEKLGLQTNYVEILIDNKDIGNYFDIVVNSVGESNASLVANYVLSDALGLQSKDISLKLPDHKNFATLMNMTIAGELSSRGAKDILAVIMKEDQDPKEYAKKNNLIQTNDTEALKKIVEEVIAENPTQVADYKSGKEAMFMYFVGQCMKKSKGSGNPALFQEILKNALK